jgi:hyperosmotically inducible protein
MDTAPKPNRQRWMAASSALAALAALALVAGLACSPPSKQEAERDRTQAREQVQQATEQTKDAARDLGRGVKQAGHELAEGAQKVGREVEPYARDAAITARVKAKLTAAPEINPLQIDVDTVDAHVTLSGKVPTEHVKEEAEHLARATDGVVGVTNRLEVGPRGG